MTLDEAIEHCEQVATEKELLAEFYKTNLTNGVLQGEEVAKCDTLDGNFRSILGESTGRYPKLIAITEWQDCAQEHRQLAEWLKELRWYWEQDLVLRETVIVTVDIIYNTCGGFDDIDYIYQKMHDIPRVRYELGLMVDE